MTTTVSRWILFAALLMCYVACCEDALPSPAHYPPPHLLQPPILYPQFSDALKANVTEVELHVRVQRLVVPLVSRGTMKHREEHNRSQGEEDPSYFFQYTGRVYVQANSSSDEANREVVLPVHARVPAPTLVVQPGGYVKVVLVNDLEDTEKSESGRPPRPTPPPGGMLNMMHSPNHTNLHFHGIHGDPHIDDPFVSIVPRESSASPSHSHSYLLPIPRDHLPGLHWYHAHHHGATYVQVMGGLFGAVIVEAPTTDASSYLPPYQHGRKKPHGSRGSQPPYCNSSCKKHHPAAMGTAQSLFNHATSSLAISPAHLLVFNVYRLRKAAEGEEGHICDGLTIDAADRLIANDLVPTAPQLVRRTRAAVPAANASDSSTPPWVWEEVRNEDEVAAVLPPDVFLVNGQHQPILTLQGDEPTLLRMLFAAGSCALNLTFPTGCHVTPAGIDGVPLDMEGSAEVSPTSWLYFTAATRHEAVVVCSLPVSNRGEDELAVVRDLRSGQPILFLNITAPVANASSSTAASLLSPFPSRRPKPQYLATSRASSPHPLLLRDVTFSQAAVPTNSLGGQPYYVIGDGSNCRDVWSSELAQPSCGLAPFEGPRGETNASHYHGFVVKKDQVVKVRVMGDPISEMPHPFHPHVNHFQFIHFVPRPDGLHTHASVTLAEFGLWPGQWRDTIPILDGVTTIRWRAADFKGEVVYHCHTLTHEDRGMMTTYLIVDEEGSSEEGAHHHHHTSHHPEPESSSREDRQSHPKNEGRRKYYRLSLRDMSYLLLLVMLPLGLTGWLLYYCGTRIQPGTEAGSEETAALMGQHSSPYGTV